MVAVKTLKENASDKERSDLVQELQVMKMLEPHPNVVRLLGCCTEKGKSRLCNHSTLLTLPASRTLLLALMLSLCQDLPKSLQMSSFKSYLGPNHTQTTWEVL